MMYLVVDALLNGTGIRNQYEGGYIDIETLGLSKSIIQRINRWLHQYENEKFNGYSNNSLIDELDNEGRQIAMLLKNELPDAKVEYYSDARMTMESI